MRIFNKSWRCVNLSRYSVSDFGTNNTSEWRHRVLRRTIPYCTSATKVRVWLAIFISSSATLSPFLFPLPASLTLDSHRFATLLPYPSCGLATKQPPCDTPQGKTALMCISESAKASNEKERKKKKRKKEKEDRNNGKNATRGYPANLVIVSENNCYQKKNCNPDSKIDR